MVARKIDQKTFESTVEIKHVKMTRKMFEACKLINTARYHSAIDSK